MSRITRNITDLGKETVTPPAPDAPRAMNGATWHLSLTIWDVHAGDLGAEIVAQTDSPESCYTLGACLERVAELIDEIHPDASHAASREKISSRQQSHRVQMSKTAGNTTFRVRYVADGRDMLATADIRRAE